MKIIRPIAITDQGGSFSRSTTATYLDKDGNLQIASPNVPRVTFKYNLTKSSWEIDGILLEQESTNILLNSETLSTQSVTTTSDTYTISFYGTGTITLSGSATGTVTGIDNNIVTSLTFTATSGTLTVTVTGSVGLAQLELGTLATSWIPTTGSSAYRAADICTGYGLIYSNIPENEEPNWNAGTPYVVDDRVIYEHYIYSRVVDGTTATSPDLDAINWILVGPTNRWNAFDDSPSTLSEGSEYITYILKPGRVNSVALLELEGTEATVNLYAEGERQYHAHTDLLNNDNVGDWYQYFYEPFYYQTSLAVTDLVNASLIDMPQYTDSIITITIRKAASTARVGIIAVGTVYELGKTQNGIALNIIDYSKKDTNTYGNTVLVRRKFSRRIRGTFFLYSSKVDVISNLLSQYRATPVVWIGVDANYSSLIIYGFYRDWEITIPNQIGSICSIEIEGLA